MEYLMTYGWAILVVIIVGIVLWQSGVFGTGAGGVSGFNRVRIEDQAWSNTTGWTASYENAAGGTMKKVNITLTGDLPLNGSVDGYTNNTGTNWAPGKEYLISAPNEFCQEGEGYAVDVTIEYASEAGITHTETGTVRGKCEA
ncbi:hypothetical protein ACFLQ2_01410 [archaeon]